MCKYYNAIGKLFTVTVVVGISATTLSTSKLHVVEFLRMRGIQLCHLCKVLKDFVAMSY